LEAFRQKLDANSRGTGFSELFYGFNFGVAMFLNSLVKKSGGSSDLAGLLIETVELPSNDQQADEKLASLLRQVELVREGGHPAPKSAAIFCSFFWWFQAPETWPFLGPASEEAVEALGWLPKDLDPIERYRRYRTLIRSLADREVAEAQPSSNAPETSSSEAITLAAVEAALTWFKDNRWIGLDQALGDRLAWAEELNDQRVDGEYPDDSLEVARTNMAAVLAEMKILGDLCETSTSDALGRSLRRRVPSEFWTKTPVIIRANAWTKWILKDTAGWNESPSLLLCADPEGIGLGISPGRRGRGWSASILDELAPLVPDGMEVIENWARPFLRAAEPTGDYLLGVRLTFGEALNNTALPDEVERVAAALQPVMDRAVALGTGVDERADEARAGSEPAEDQAPDEGAEPADEGAELEERLDALVDECHLDGRAFVDDLVELLRDKRQIVLY
ncbi:MAG: hypothetical protein KDB24_17585, partial [Microthrixaceae bacterium]|nr:hypothetical protein [Microthrixaceae bacterium]